jgi:hypothetical protein
MPSELSDRVSSQITQLWAVDHPEQTISVGFEQDGRSEYSVNSINFLFNEDLFWTKTRRAFLQYYPNV